MSLTMMAYVDVAPARNGLTGISVTPIWTGVDRPTSSGWCVRDLKMANRLKAAIENGSVLYDVQVKTDVNGKTYVSYSSRVLARRMNADLKRLGF